MRKKILKIILFLFYIGGLIIFSEFLLRYFFPLDRVKLCGEPELYYKMSKNKDIGYELRPSVEEINSDGLRDFEHSIDKPVGVRRIMIIGDSIAYGFEVAKEDTYASILQKMLNSKQKDKYEVINLGVTGYGTVQIKEHFKDKGLKYKPDIVIYGYWFNDHDRFGCVVSTEHPFFQQRGAAAWELYAWAQKHILGKCLRKRLIRTELFKRAVYLCYICMNKTAAYGKEKREPHLQNNDSQIITKLYERYHRLVLDISKSNEIDFLNSNNLNLENFKDYYHAFYELSEICKENSIRLIVLMTPVMSDFSDYKYQPLHKFVEDLARNFDLEVVDTFGYFRQREYRAYGICDYDSDVCHFNELGHAVVAKALFEYLTK